jgi:hypothetical protein
MRTSAFVALGLTPRARRVILEAEIREPGGVRMEPQTETRELPEGALLAEGEADELDLKKCVAIVLTSKAGNWCDSSECDALYPAGRRLELRCDGDECPVDTSHWYFFPCEKGGQGYVSGCQVKFSSVARCQ